MVKVYHFKKKSHIYSLLWTSFENDLLRRIKNNVEREIKNYFTYVSRLFFNFPPFSNFLHMKQYTEKNQHKTQQLLFHILFFLFYIFFSSSLSWKLCLMVWRLKKKLLFQCFFYVLFLWNSSKYCEKMITHLKSCF